MSHLQENWHVLIASMMLWIYACAFPAHAQRLQFESYGREDGIISGTIEAIYQDNQGYIWVGAEDVMLRFDGHNFKSYEQRQRGAQNQNIRHITEDKLGRLWYAAGGSLFLHDEISDSFNEYVPEGVGEIKDLAAYSEFIYQIVPHKEDALVLVTRGGMVLLNTLEKSWKPAAVTDGLIGGFRKNEESAFWVWHRFNGAFILDDNLNVVQRFEVATDTSSGVPEQIHAIFEAQDGTVWIIGSDVVYATREDLKQKRFTSLFDASGSNKGIFIHHVLDKDGHIWLGSDRGELIQVDYLTKEIAYEQQVEVGNARGVAALYFDRQGVMWVGVDRDGLKKSKTISPGIRLIDPVASAFSTRIVSQFAEDGQGKIWVGTDGSGLSRYDPETDRVDCYLTSENSALASDAVIEVFTTSKDELLVATYPTGLYVLLAETCTLRALDELSTFRINALYEDEEGTLWFAELQGLVAFRLDKPSVTRYPSPEGYHDIYALHLTRWKDYLVVSSWIDVSLFDLAKKAFLPDQWLYSQIPSAMSLPHEKVNMTAVDEDNRLWLGTERGLVRYNEQQEAFELYFKEAGLPGLAIQATVVDNDGYLWLSTDNGIAQFDTKRQQVVQTFAPNDGLQGFEFNRVSGFKDSEGRLYFGGYRGFNVIDPQQLGSIKDVTSGPVVITSVHGLSKKKSTDLTENDEDSQFSPQTAYRIDKRSADVLPDSMGFRDIRFSFAHLDFLDPKRNRFKYRLLGVSDTWHDTDEQHVTYHSLAPGEYTFEVKATNAFGQAGKNTAFYSFAIRPYWYETTWFLCVLILTGLGCVGIVYRWRIKQVQVRNEKLKQLVGEQTREIREKNTSLEAVNQQIEHKNVSLAAAYEEAQVINDNLISMNQSLEKRTDQLRESLEKNKEILGITAHDLKNPLGGIIGLAEIILEDIQDDPDMAFESTVENLPLLKSEAERMLKIITDLLDRYREGTEIALNKEKMVVGDIVAAVIRWNTKQAKNKEIELHYMADEMAIVKIDTMAIQRVLDNYVSNAIKYSPPQSHVWISTYTCELGDDSFVRIAVKDEGPGLTNEDKQKAFGKMQRLSAKPTAGEHSTGLGLFIAKQLVEAHGGAVGVDSVHGEGATFWFTLPECKLIDDLVGV